MEDQAEQWPLDRQPPDRAGLVELHMSRLAAVQHVDRCTQTSGTRDAQREPFGRGDDPHLEQQGVGGEAVDTGTVASVDASAAQGGNGYAGTAGRQCMSCSFDHRRRNPVRRGILRYVGYVPRLLGSISSAFVPHRYPPASPPSVPSARPDTQPGVHAGATIRQPRQEPSGRHPYDLNARLRTGDSHCPRTGVGEVRLGPSRRPRGGPPGCDGDVGAPCLA